ncbi:hypothetical protein LOK49_LG02G01166 [Camellia lanceoleosa]|uniref:Uncharacterized protein n=1 Tax=Camellia lanceoleosa TaxID=1840588 RepID=A0ACC0IKQ3_9ERIC|nr:hypothetical protein LOK49_LG02G01166 [Camellia lanceoleosa]
MHLATIEKDDVQDVDTDATTETNTVVKSTRPQGIRKEREGNLSMHILPRILEEYLLTEYTPLLSGISDMDQSYILHNWVCSRHQQVFPAVIGIVQYTSNVSLSLFRFVAAVGRKLVVPNPDPRIHAPTVGKVLLKSRGFITDDYMFWVCVGALLGFSLLFNILFIAALTFLNPLSDSKSIVLDEDVGKKNKKSSGRMTSKGAMVSANQYLALRQLSGTSSLSRLKCRKLELDTCRIKLESLLRDSKCFRSSGIDLGLWQPRLEGEEYLSIVDEFKEAIHSRWPKAIVQTATVSKKRFYMFNDDMQGTAGVALAGLLGTVRAQGRPLTDFVNQKIVVVGAGSARLGVFNMAAQAISRMAGAEASP